MKLLKMCLELQRGQVWKISKIKKNSVLEIIQIVVKKILQSKSKPYVEIENVISWGM